MLHEPIYGAYTQLWAGLSTTVQLKDSGRYVLPWGRFGEHPKNMTDYLRSRESGSSKAAQFYQYCDTETKAYL
jgi:retinol dehydrogenase 12